MTAKIDILKSKLSSALQRVRRLHGTPASRPRLNPACRRRTTGSPSSTIWNPGCITFGKTSAPRIKEMVAGRWNRSSTSGSFLNIFTTLSLSARMGCGCARSSRSWGSPPAWWRRRPSTESSPCRCSHRPRLLSENETRRGSRIDEWGGVERHQSSREDVEAMTLEKCREPERYVDVEPFSWLECG